MICVGTGRSWRRSRLILWLSIIRLLRGLRCITILILMTCSGLSPRSRGSLKSLLILKPIILLSLGIQRSLAIWTNLKILVFWVSWRIWTCVSANRTQQRRITRLKWSTTNRQMRMTRKRSTRRSLKRCMTRSNRASTSRRSPRWRLSQQTIKPKRPKENNNRKSPNHKNKSECNNWTSRLRATKTTSDNTTTTKSSHFCKKSLYRGKNKHSPWTKATANNTSNPTNKPTAKTNTWCKRSATTCNPKIPMASPNIKTYLTSKTSTPKQSNNNSNSTKNHPLTTITRDGSGCNSPGSAWLWNLTTPISWGSVSPPPPVICPFRRKGSLPFRPWRLH